MFCFECFKFEIPIRHLDRHVKLEVEYMRLEIRGEVRAVEVHLGVTNIEIINENMIQSLGSECDSGRF